jgi:glucosyl-3-phosphoglycerate synthase
MAEFYQTGVVATLHRLTPGGLDRLEADLDRFTRRAPIGLVLPALYSEFETPSMPGIIEELAKVRFIKQIVLPLARADEEQYARARAFFDGFPYPVKIIWINSPRIQDLFRILEENGVAAGADGKGRSVWLSFGYLLAQGGFYAMGLHDCDIVNYSRELVAKLFYPVCNPNLGFEFSKGYYARVTDRMHGRVTRLFLTPLIRAMESMSPAGVVLPPQGSFLRFLDSFRYPLAGEFALRSNLARVIRIPGDWGLEVGVLAEIHRNSAVPRVCQVDVADNYEHKHQILSEDNPQQGLRKMATDIAKSLFRTMAGEGIVFGTDHFRTLQVRYVRMAEDTIHRYYADAMINGLQFDRHGEEVAVAAFARSLRQAAEEFLEDPLGLPLIPSWNRVVAAIPDFFERLRNAVEHPAEAVV